MSAPLSKTDPHLTCIIWVICAFVLGGTIGGFIGCAL